ncbi:membrane dipeptidase [Planctopirus hydrillae]|uniref:Membrane dipeptidase n=2 Tax=Planctopirus hydrillae TaxID=1841610 RepID=A0A1C3EQN4_9PLAN|nr:membrane dipeptidase [Planctopirus hydrillae]
MLFDGHNDLPWQIHKLAKGSVDRLDLTVPQPLLHTDFPKLKQSGLKAQFWSVYVPADTYQQGTSLTQTLEQIQIVRKLAQKYPDQLELAYSSADIERIVAQGKIASLMGAEGGYSIQCSIPILQQLYREGVRYMTLTHSKTIEWADSATDQPQHGGLTPFGEEVVREMNRLGMLVDLSHVSEETMLDALDITKAPVIFSHSSAKAICNHPRNVSDAVLKRVTANGGIVMVNFMSGYIVPTERLKANPKDVGTLDDVVDHIVHIAKVAGVEHVGIGSDFDGVRQLPRGLEDVSKYPDLTKELIRRGFTKPQIHAILGGNILRVLKEAEQVAKSSKQP